MKELRFTLIGDGSSDKALVNIIKWLLGDLYPHLPIYGQYADFRKLPNPPVNGDVLAQVESAQRYYTFDILFYHRDAESNKKNIVQVRKAEVLSQITSEHSSKTVCVVPVVMMETWLLISESAIKKAAGNRNYKGVINLPSPTTLENIKEPKDILHDYLKEVSGLKKRNLKNFNVHQAVHLVAENINDFSLLRHLESFKVFEADLKGVMKRIGY